jgi:Fe-S-cluster containining protein
MAMLGSLPVINLSEAKFECIFGRGCEGICCQKGKPPVTEEDVARIEQALPRALPLLRDSARKKIEKEGYLSNWKKAGRQTLRVADTWCVFFNQGCVLHKLGMMEGDTFKYKPVVCAVFPLDVDEEGAWYVRQWGVAKEPWDLFCLNPQASPRPAAESLRVELQLVERLATESSD